MNNITDGLYIPSQKNLNPKPFFIDLVDLKDLGVSNMYAYTYYNNMLAFCEDNESFYIWRETTENSTTGVLDTNFRYPDNYINGGYDYSLKYYNFFRMTFANNVVQNIPVSYFSTNLCVELTENPVQRYLYDIKVSGNICIYGGEECVGKEIIVTNISGEILNCDKTTSLEFHSNLKTPSSTEIDSFPPLTWFRARVMLFNLSVPYFLIVEKGTI